MKRGFIFIFIAFVHISLHSQITISGTWKFKTGDQKEWSNKEFNDSEWADIRVNELYDSQGFQNYDGVSWYRKKIIIPSSQKTRGNNKYNYFVLDIGMIDDADETFVNGVRVGKTGSFEKQDGTSHSTKRTYLVDHKIINWDKENVIAVRVKDFSGTGGLYKGTYSFYAASFLDFIEIKNNVLSESGVFKKGEKISFSTSFYNKTPENVTGKLIYIISRDTHEQIEKKDVPLNIRPSDSSIKTITFEVGDPGFYQINFIYSLNGKDNILQDSTYFGYDPANFDCGTSRPSDFEAYWKTAKEELAKVSPRFSMRYDSSVSTEKISVYEVEMYSLDNIRVKGWYSVPKNFDNNKKLPALLRHIGYSGNNPPVTDRPEFAVLTFNIRGHGNSKLDFNPGFPQYLTYHLDDKNTYVYRGAYMDCLRAMDFLCSRPEVDTTRIAVYGGSQGGALSVATAALDRRVALCAPHVPFLSDFRHYFKVVSFPGKFVENYRKDNPDVSWEQIFSTLDYIDIKNLAPWVKVPVFMGVGLKDRICPPHINFAAFNNIASIDKQWFVFKNYAHAVPDTQHKAELEWIKMKFGMK